MVKVSKGRRVEDEAMALAMIRQADMEEMFIKVREGGTTMKGFDTCGITHYISTSELTLRKETVASYLPLPPPP